jgi:SAM-dependent methyltransferase
MADPQTHSQSATNLAVYADPGLVDEYSTLALRPVESVVIARLADELRGSAVLELGCGAGRVTGHLRAAGAHVTGLDVSPAMVEHCRRVYPDATFVVGDMRDLGRFADAAFGCVVAPFNVLDAVGHEERLGVLEAVHRVLAPGGSFAFSSHNRADAASAHPPGLPSRRPWVLLRVLRNQRRLRPFEREEREYAILNDCAHEYGLLHYYVDRESQRRQLEACGFELLDCLDLDGASLPPGDDAPGCPELHYLARRVDRPAPR